MSTVEKWLTGVTVLAIIATVVGSGSMAPQVIGATGSAVSNIYKSAMGKQAK